MKGTGQSSGFLTPLRGSQPNQLGAHARKSSIMNEKELAFEEKVHDIVKKHQKYLKPIEIIDVNYDSIDTHTSVILDNEDNLKWDFVDGQQTQRYEEDKAQKELRRKETKETVERMRRTSLVRKYTFKTKSHITDLFQLKLLNDPTYLKNHQEITKSDKAILKRIMTLTVIAIVLDIAFAGILFVIYSTHILQNPVGMITSIWVTSFLEMFAVTVIIFLFSIVQTQEKENLRLIMRIGQNRNRINRLYGFVLPAHLRQEESKKKLEKSINQMTAKYMKTVASVPK